MGHRIKDLDTCVAVDVDGGRFLGAVNAGISVRRGTVMKVDRHCCQCSVHGCTAYFDGDEGVEDTNSRLEGCEVLVLVRENTELGWRYSQAYSSGDVLLGWLEPCISLGLRAGLVSALSTTRKRTLTFPQT